MKLKSKEIVAQRLDELMSSVESLDTQQKLASRTGIGQTTIGRIRRGEVNATAENLKKIADAFGVTVGFLYGEEPMPEALKGEEAQRAEDKKEWQARNHNVEEALTRGKLPLISWVQAGAWSEIVDNFHKGDAEDWIPCPFTHGPNAFILKVVGHSMYDPAGPKSYAPGEFIAVDPRREAMNRSMVVVRVDHEDTATFKQLLIEPDGTHLLQALNPSWPQRIIPMPPGSTIVGVVIGKWLPE